MIKLSGVGKTYSDGGKNHRVLDGVDLHVEKGGFAAVLGASGSGKSTLLNLVGGLDSDFEGDIHVGDYSLKKTDDRSLSVFRRKTVGFVFQSFHLIPELSALDNISLPGWFSSEFDKSERLRSRALEMLESVGLKDKGHRRPEHLSGGERQRVAIARALFCGPEILLCDEPTGNLDHLTGSEIIDLFCRLNETGITLLMVTHEARVADAAKRHLMLADGKLSDTNNRNLTEEAMNKIQCDLKSGSVSRTGNLESERI